MVQAPFLVANFRNTHLRSIRFPANNAPVKWQKEVSYAFLPDRKRVRVPSAEDFLADALVKSIPNNAYNFMGLIQKYGHPMGWPVEVHEHLVRVLSTYHNYSEIYISQINRNLMLYRDEIEREWSGKSMTKIIMASFDLTICRYMQEFRFPPTMWERYIRHPYRTIRRWYVQFCA